MKKVSRIIFLVMISVSLFACKKKSGTNSNKHNTTKQNDDITYHTILDKTNEKFGHIDINPKQDQYYAGQSLTLSMFNDVEGYDYSGIYCNGVLVAEANLIGFTMPDYDVELYASFIPIKYDAVFMVDNQIYDTREYTVEDSVISNVPNIPEKTGYNSYWNSYQIKPGGIVIEAIYTKKTYNVIWKNYDNTVLFQEEYSYGENIKYDGEVPKKEIDDGYIYEFSGWDNNALIADDNYVFTATYKKMVEYTFVYADNSTVPVIIDYDKNIEDYFPVNSESKIVERTKYKYNGWECIDSRTYKEKVSVSNLFFVDYILDNGINSPKNLSMYEENEDVIFYSATKTGYSFTGWYTDDEYNTEIRTIDNIDSDYTLYAKFDIISYSILYDLDGGTNAIKNPLQYTYEDIIELKPATKTGYTFISWYTDSDLSFEIINIVEMHENLHLFAKFIPNNYDISLNSNGGTMVSEKKYKIYYYSSSTTLWTTTEVSPGESANIYLNSHPAKTGYNFSGWYKEKSLTNLIMNENILIDSDLSVYAKWTVDKSNRNISTGTYGIQEPNRSGEYIFRVPGNVTGAITFSYYIYSNTPYVVGGGSGGGSDLEVKSLITGTKYFYIEQIYKNDSIGVRTATINSFPGDSIRFYFRGFESWVNPWIKFESGWSSTNVSTCIGSTTDTHETVTFDTIPVFPQYERTGYSFDGWYYNDTLIDMNEAWKIAEDATLEAHWSLIEYTITYDLDGGINNSSNPPTYTINSNFTLKDPSKDGYTFNYWTIGDSSTTITKISKRTGNISLYAHFTVNTYTLTLDSNGGNYDIRVRFYSNGECINAQYVGTNNHISYLEPNGRDGFAFGGWYSDDTFGTLFNFDSNINENIDLYAKWISINELAQIIESDTSSLNDISVTGKEQVIFAFVPKMSGNYSFASIGDLDTIGYLYDASMNIITSNDDISDSELNFEIAYNLVAGQLYYIGVKTSQSSVSGLIALSITGNSKPQCSGYGSTYSTQTLHIEYDETFDLPIPSLDGYIFDGWYDSDNNKYESGTWNYIENLTLYANWISE